MTAKWVVANKEIQYFFRVIQVTKESSEFQGKLNQALLFGLAAIFTLVLCVGGANSTTPNDLAARLNAISDAANNFCDAVPLSGSSESISGKVDGDIKLGMIARALAQAGLEGEFDYRADSYEGLARSELAGALENRTECKLKFLSFIENNMTVQPVPVQSTSRGIVIRHSVLDRQSVEVCDGKSSVFVSFHPVAGQAPSGLTAKSSALESDTIVRPGGPPIKLSPECSFSLDGFRYLGSRTYEAQLREIIS